MKTKEEIKAYNKAYQQAHKDELYQKKKEYLKNNPDKAANIKKKQRQYRIEHKAELQEKAQEKARIKRAAEYSKRVIEDLPNEEWKQVTDNYEISNQGRLKNTKFNRLLKPQINKKSGYYHYSINKVHYYVHRLVATAFLPNTDNKPCIDHINRDKADNRVQNLKWCTYKENSNNPLTIQAYKISNKQNIAKRWGNN